MSKLYIGTSNIVIPGNKQSFPEAFRTRSRLHYYSTIFNSVEINSSFYKIPMLSTFQKWALDVPDDFTFTIKLHKAITHAKGLMYDKAEIRKFMTAVVGLGSKKGCLLIQFPGKITLDYFHQVEEIAELISELDPGNEWKKALEFRHPSWYIGETYELLDEFNSSLVLHDNPKAKTDQLNTKAAFAYLRFHGPTGNYRDSYTYASLNEKSLHIKQWLNEGKEVYVYFNNTIGDAFLNAKYLRSSFDHLPVSKY